jgi:hypothetical protein
MNPMQHVACVPDANGNYFATFPDRPVVSEQEIQRVLSQVLKDKGLTFASLATAISWPGAPNADGLKSWFDNGSSGIGPRKPTIPLSYVNAILALLRPGAPTLTNPGGPGNPDCSREALVQALGMSGDSQYGQAGDLS